MTEKKCADCYGEPEMAYFEGQFMSLLMGIVIGYIIGGMTMLIFIA